MNFIYYFGIDTSKQFFNFYTNGESCNKKNFLIGYPPNMEPHCPIEYYPKNYDSYNDIYIYNKIIHHIADLLLNKNNIHGLNYPILRATGDSILDDWCLHRYMRYKLTYDMKLFVHPIFLDILNSQSLIDMEKKYDILCDMIINHKYYKIK
jgi:hypothetical protein